MNERPFALRKAEELRAALAGATTPDARIDAILAAFGDPGLGQAVAQNALAEAEEKAGEIFAALEKRRRTRRKPKRSLSRRSRNSTPSPPTRNWRPVSGAESERRCRSR